MARKNANISLTKFDDIFKTQEDFAERVVEIPLSELYPFYNHPFQVKEDAEMEKTVESVKQYGVLNPAIARPRKEGGYELISGHRRHRASELAGKETMPVIIREMDDDEAVILMVDANLQRETILPSERAFAYRMKLEAMKHQGERADITSRQLVDKLKSADVLGNDIGESGRQIQRYIRLTELIPELLKMVDEKCIAFNSAVELSYLKKEEQKNLLDAMEYAQATPSLSQAQRLKKFSREGNCSLEVMKAIMSEESKSDPTKVTFKTNALKKYFPKNYTSRQMEEKIINLLEQWQKKRYHDMER